MPHREIKQTGLIMNAGKDFRTAMNSCHCIADPTLKKISATTHIVDKCASKHGSNITKEEGILQERCAKII